LHDKEEMGLVSGTLTAFFIFAIVSGIAAAMTAWRWRRIASREIRIVLTGGGTGGHVNPALAIAEGIRNREPAVGFYYIGVRGKAESVIVKQAGYPLGFVTSEGFPGLRPSLRLLRFLCKLTVGVAQSAGFLIWFAPRWVVATGGYVSAPIIVASLLLRMLGVSPAKVFLHEQNSIPGQLNALLGRWVDRVLLTFPQTLPFFPKNGVLVGYPIRHSIALKPREEAYAQLPFRAPEGCQIVFVFGGSQGARTINRALVDALPLLIPHRERLFIVHGTGLAKSNDYDAAADTKARLQMVLSTEEQAVLDSFYYRQDYFHNIAAVYSISDLIVCRSGAGSLNEITRMGKPAFLIPKANLPGDHQVMNARALKQSGATEILFEDTVVENGKVLEKLEGKLFADRILQLLEDPERLREMGARGREFFRQRAVDRILSEIYNDHSFDNGTCYESATFMPLMNNQRLLSVLGAAYSRSPRDYDPLTTIGDEDDLVYYQHRAAALLTHKDWQDRNLGVKLIGLTHYRQKVPALLHMLVDRTPASLIRRCFGGDFEQVGFIRRNTVQALQVLNRFDADIEKHLLIAVEDPYFEVRAQLCGAVAHFADHLVGKKVWIDTMLSCLKDKTFEVVTQAVKALGEIGTEQAVLEVLLQLRESYYWQVRNAALIGIRRLAERNVVRPSEEMLKEISSFILTATDFQPHFSIKETYETVKKCWLNRLDEDDQCRQTSSSHPTPDKRTD
jgi:UDP-N-acetylglucosamine--N-acetylmuramyl-(pentapeptide) pyrophosphoryl-undecaprenol N-acetylglucosamine transferase